MKNIRHSFQVTTGKLRNILNYLPDYKQLNQLNLALQNENNQLKSQLAKLSTRLEEVENQYHALQSDLWVPPGHFYSPIPAKDEKILYSPNKALPGINLNESQQIELVGSFARFYPEMPFTDDRQENLRFFFENPNFSYGDSITLYSMLRHLKPSRLIEVGSGYSSCVTLDTNEFFLNSNLNCTFIEPYPELLLSLTKEQERPGLNIISSRLQATDITVFDSLQANDILFIDSTHISKLNSDVNYLLFEVLPRLCRGVYVHFHDVFYPFEYPVSWLEENRAWNENYILHAFLQYNNNFEIVFFNDFIINYHKDWFSQHMPLSLKNPGGSLWLRKTC